MQIETVTNGGISLVIIPENVYEEELLKQLMKQNNIVSEFRSALTILNRSFPAGILIQKKSAASTDTEGELVRGKSKATKADDNKEETV